MLKKSEITPDVIKGKVDMFKTIRNLYFLTDYDERGIFADIMKTDNRTAEKMWIQWLIKDKDIVKGNILAPEIPTEAELQEEHEANKKLLTAIFSVGADELSVGDLVKDADGDICTVTYVDKDEVHVVHETGETAVYDPAERFTMIHKAEDGVARIEIEVGNE